MIGDDVFRKHTTKFGREGEKLLKWALPSSVKRTPGLNQDVMVSVAVLSLTLIVAQVLGFVQSPSVVESFLVDRKTDIG